jgi:RHS repeat-associated protein
MVARTAVGPQQLIQLEYDCQSRRIGKKLWNNTGGTGNPVVNLRFLYDGWNLLAEVDGLNNNAKVRSYVWGNDLSGSPQGAGGVAGLLKVTYCGSATTNAFVAYDGNGNLAGLVDAANGTPCAQHEYGPFGEVIRMSGPTARANPFRFSTKYQDDETDLLYYGYRYYNAGMGRWISRDPVAETAGQGLYAMCGNSAINSYDPLGLRACCACLLIKPVVAPAMRLYQPGEIQDGLPEYWHVGLPITWRIIVTGEPTSCTCTIRESGYFVEKLGKHPEFVKHVSEARTIPCWNYSDSPGTSFLRPPVFPDPSLTYFYRFHIRQIVTCKGSSPDELIMEKSILITNTFGGKFDFPSP